MISACCFVWVISVAPLDKPSWFKCPHCGKACKAIDEVTAKEVKPEDLTEGEGE